MKWGVTLIVSNYDIENRLIPIVEYISTNFGKSEYYISDVDATGKMGNDLTNELNNNQGKKISVEQIFSLLKEDGQVFDLYLTIKANDSFFISVQRGMDVDILGDGVRIPASIIGESVDLSPDIVESYTIHNLKF